MTLHRLDRLTANNRRTAFTLVEMMIVLCLISIVMTYAVPEIKKAYEDFRVNETLEHVRTLISSFRSYYLLQNEFPEDSSTRNLVRKNSIWCLPSCYYTRDLKNEQEYYLRIKPYQGTYYDIDNWIKKEDKKNFHITIFTDKQDGWLMRLREKFGLFANKQTQEGVTIEDFQEINFGITNEDSDKFRNRYY